MTPAHRASTLALSAHCVTARLIQVATQRREEMAASMSAAHGAKANSPKGAWPASRLELLFTAHSLTAMAICVPARAMYCTAFAASKPHQAPRISRCFPNMWSTGRPAAARPANSIRASDASFSPSSAASASFASAATAGIVFSAAVAMAFSCGASFANKSFTWPKIFLWPPLCCSFRIFAASTGGGWAPVGAAAPAAAAAGADNSASPCAAAHT
mmetsp:Transcript_15279/g.43308  ORF Transcript_15279/g.43308 Transcript_15279/m.43308 type:complete len:215 (+) Transcript_15279:774-1418(+)